MHFRHICVPLHRLKRCDLTLLRPRCLCWTVPVSVSLKFIPEQRVYFLELYNMETFYLELLFLGGKTVYGTAPCIWEGAWPSEWGSSFCISGHHRQWAIKLLWGMCLTCSLFSFAPATLCLWTKRNICLMNQTLHLHCNRINSYLSEHLQL